MNFTRPRGVRARSRTSPARAVDRLLPLLYDRLRTVARRHIRDEGRDHTLQPTALVHEVYLRLAGSGVDWNGPAHFLALAAREMRRILVDHARAAGAAKRGGGLQRIPLADDLAMVQSRPLDSLALDEALDHLAARHSRRARVVEMRLFAGMLHDEIAAVLGVTDRTVKEDWKMARAWLARELRRGSGRRHEQ